MEIQVQITRQENADYFNAKINDIVTVDFEQYVAAVVASEIGNSPLEACKAQAVAARTYAVKRGVLRGKPISDSSLVAQAYRANRYDIKVYPNCIKAANDTAGEVLYYNKKPIDAVYSSSNGGMMVSAEEKWGSMVPYLIAKEDPWTLASGYKKNGHSVGMSQQGCIYAAKHNFSYHAILNFYYPQTTLMFCYGENLSDIAADLKLLHNKLDEIQAALSKIKEELL